MKVSNPPAFENIWYFENIGKIKRFVIIVDFFRECQGSFGETY